MHLFVCARRASNMHSATFIRDVVQVLLELGMMQYICVVESQRAPAQTNVILSASYFLHAWGTNANRNRTVWQKYNTWTIAWRTRILKCVDVHIAHVENNQVHMSDKHFHT